MKKLLLIVLGLFLFASCGKKKGNMIVSGQIKGLKKGNLYLKKMIDTSLVAVDSIEIFGNETFELSDDVTSPQMYAITFNSTNQEKKILFFGEATNITIEDNIEQLGWKPKISGSKNHELYEKFKKIDRVYKNKRLNFIKRDIEARAKKDTAKVTQLEKEYKKMMRKRFASTIQFALFYKDYEVAPYLAISELFDANFMFIDSINNNLSDNVKKSVYGKQLQEYVDNVKAAKN